MTDGTRAGRAAASGRRRARLRGAALLVVAVAAFVAGGATGAHHDGHGGAAHASSPGGTGDGGSGTGESESSGSGAAAEGQTVSSFHDPVPILMYHAISPAPPDAALPDLFVPQAEFEEQMKWLADHGYVGVTLADVFAAWNDGEPIARKPVVVSFDDGLLSQFVGARPMLQRLGWPGVLNLEIAHLDQGELTDDQVNELLDEGWELDSHTFTHPDLTEAGVDLEHEIADSRTELQRRFNVPVDFFCYPAGQYDQAVIDAVRRAGYEGATTTVEGLASPARPYELARIRVEPGEGGAGLASKLDAG